MIGALTLADFGRRRTFTAVAAVIAIGLVYYYWTGADPNQVTGNLLPPQQIELAADELEIPAGAWNSWSWSVDSRRPVCTVDVAIRGIAGGNRDFEAFLMDEDGYRNWQNQTNPSAFYQSGRVSSATVNGTVDGAGPKYYLVVSNRFSTFSTKTVRAEQGRVICRAR